jgi:pimeloyl-ACP methyl ester carboxylesterase
MLPDDATERTLDLPGLRMHVVALGPEDGLPVLLLHGFPEFWYSWRFQMPALAAAGYRVYAPDQRGYNLTEARGPFDIDTLVGDIRHLQDALGIPCADIVGHDWGGVVAWAFAARHPERVRRMAVLNGPHPGAYLAALRSSLSQCRKSWYIAFFQLPGLPEWVLRRRDHAALRKVYAAIPKAYMSDVDIDRYVQALSRPGSLSATLGWYRALPTSLLRKNPATEARLSMPVCVIWGERDHALDTACNTALPRYVQDLQIHYHPEGTHWVQMDHPEETNALLLAFLSGTAP